MSINIIDWIKNKFRKENSLYVVLKDALVHRNFNTEIRIVYFLCGILYSPENLKQIKSNLTIDALNNLRIKYSFDVLKDNILLYIIEDIYGKHFLILLLDPYEPLKPETILEIIPVNDIAGYDMQAIFSNS